MPLGILLAVLEPSSADFWVSPAGWILGQVKVIYHLGLDAFFEPTLEVLGASRDALGHHFGSLGPLLGRLFGIPCGLDPRASQGDISSWSGRIF